MATANEKTNSGPVPVGEEPEGFITKPTVARRMNKCTRTIDNLMRDGLPFYKVGRSTIFRWSEVVSYLTTRCRVIHGAN
jgi:hypothetical protein